MKKGLAVLLALALVLGTMSGIAFAEEATAVAKVGDVEYTTIDDAIANWTKGTTLTLLADVQLSDVIELDNREPRTLDLGTFTMTAASGKNAITLQPLGDIKGSNPIHYFTINADETNPGGIYAPGKTCIESIGNNKWACRMELVINGGVFDGGNSIKHSNSLEQSAPWITINDGEFKAAISTDKAKIHIKDGVFRKYNTFKGTETGSYTVISGGRFYSLGFMTAKVNALCFGSNPKNLTNYDCDVYIDSEGYYCVVPAITSSNGYGASVPASAAPSSNIKNYSNVKNSGVFYYEDANYALTKNTAKTVTIYEDADADITTTGALVIDATSGADYTGDVTLNKDTASFTIKLAEGEEYTGKVKHYKGVLGTETVTENGVTTVTYTNNTDISAAVAGIGERYYFTLEEAVEVAAEDAEIVLVNDVENENVTIAKNVTVKADSMSRAAKTLNNVIFTVENDVKFALDGAMVRGLSYIYAKTPKSISVTNCDINVTTKESPRNNTPPGFVLLSSSQVGSVELIFTNNTLLAAPDATEAYQYTHGITGWNSISSATITGNTFGSAEAPFDAAAVKLMNFVDGAEVTISNNTIHADSEDTTWGPNAIQLYQCNSRDNEYTATISGNTFYVGDTTAAVGINSLGKGNGNVIVTDDNMVNDEEIDMSDVIVFGNGINDAPAQGGYIGVGAVADTSGKFTSGTFAKESEGIEDLVADGYTLETDVAGNLHIVEDKLLVDTIKIEFAEKSAKEDEIIYNINLTANGKIINRLNSVDLQFLFKQLDGKNDFEIIASNKEVAINPVDNSKVRYEFHYNGKTNVSTDTAAIITIGQVKFTGYGKFSFAVDTTATTNVAHATKLFDNIVDTFVPDGSTGGKLLVANSTTGEVEIAVPKRILTINITFPNEVKKQVAAYQDMKVEITGTIDGINQTVTYNLGEGEIAMVDGKYVVTERRLVLNNAYTVTVSGAGYRTARYTVTMTDNKELNFWNNVMDEKKAVEPGKASSEVIKNFLAGDIVKDNQINIYDLSAVVSYFATTNETDKESGYAKYDLNRDGVIDSKDVAYVLVSWGE